MLKIQKRKMPAAIKHLKVNIGWNMKLMIIFRRTLNRLARFLLEREELRLCSRPCRVEFSHRKRLKTFNKIKEFNTFSSSYTFL